MDGEKKMENPIKQMHDLGGNTHDFGFNTQVARTPSQVALCQNHLHGVEDIQSP